MRLWEIDEAIQNCIDWETGEIVDPEYLDRLHLERSKKIEGVALYIKELSNFSDNVSKEIESLQKRKKSAETAVKGMKEWLARACYGKKFETPKAKISFRESQETVIDDESLLLKKYFTKKISYTVSKTAIKEALLSGKKVKGAHINNKLNTIVK